MITPVSGKPNLLLGAYDLATLGYRAEEFFVSGTAKSYAARDTEGTGDTGGTGGTGDYVTRIVALIPEAGTFNGTVLVEWLNVSGGIDAPAVWMMAHREIARSGFGYVAVSAQRVGVEGGESLVGFDLSLKTLDPERYSRLTHPGDAYSYDIFTQVGRLLADGAVPGLEPVATVAVGESQSAMYLTTYVNDVDRDAATYDGFLVHSRFGSGAPLDGGSAIAASSAAPFRDDLRVPVLTVITETDLLDGHLLGYRHARRPDNPFLRAWEIPGSAHADNYTIKVGGIDNGLASVEDLAAAYGPTDELMGTTLSYCINFGPQHHYVLQAAIATLNTWVRTGEPAPAAAPIALTDTDPPQFALDASGLAQGGVRTPWVDVPIARTSGLAPDESPMSFLFGSGEVFDEARLQSLYPGGSEEYVQLFTEALDQAIAAGFILPADRSEILELAPAAIRTPW